MAYATQVDLANLGLSPAALAPIAAAQQLAALQAASDYADGYLAARFTLPLIGQVSQDLVRAVVAIAAEDLLVTRGYNPEAGADAVIAMRAEHARQWFREVAKGGPRPNVTDSSPGAAQGIPAPDAQPEVVSPGAITSTGTRTRGW